MSDSSKLRGHGHKFSVADAATLFGSAADDPFAVIEGHDLGNIDEEAPEETTEAPSVSEEVDQGTPKMKTTAALPDSTTHAPDVEGSSGMGSHDATTTKKFDPSSPTSLFPASSANDDWLHQESTSEAATSHIPGDQAQEVDHLGYTQYGDYAQQYEEHRDTSHYFGTTGENEQQGISYQYDQEQEQYKNDQQYTDYQYNDQIQQYQNDEYTDHQQQYYGTQHYDGQQYADPGNYGGQQEGDYGGQQGISAVYEATGYEEQSNVYHQEPHHSIQHETEQPQLGDHQMTHDYYATTNQFKPDLAYETNAAQQYGEEEQQSYEAFNEQREAPLHYGEHEQSSQVMEQRDLPQDESQYLADQSDEQLQSGDNVEDKSALQNDSLFSSRHFDEQHHESDSTVQPFETLRNTGETPEHTSNAYDWSGHEEVDEYQQDSSIVAHQEDETQQVFEEQLLTPDYFGSVSAPGESYQPDPQYFTRQYEQQQPQYDVHLNNGAHYNIPGDTEDQYRGVSSPYPTAGYEHQDNLYQQDTQYLKPPGDEQHQQTADYNGSAGFDEHDHAYQSNPMQQYDEMQQSREVYGTEGYAEQQQAPSSINGHAMDAAQERQKARIPLASFSIDGKLLTFFPTWSQDVGEGAYGEVAGGGYGMGQSSVPTKVTLRPLRSLIPPTSYASSKNPLDFPGPALEAGTTQGSALSRATGTGTAATKAKKALLIKYLDDAANEMHSGIGYLSAGKHATEAKRMGDRILILRLLALLLNQDGNLTTNAAFDMAAKDLLLADEGTAATKTNATSSLSGREPTSGPTAEQKAKFLDQIEELLVIGQRKEAVDVAVRTKMWTHAVVIASGMDVATWREVVGQFMMSEFEDDGLQSYQSLKVAYNLFSGQEPKTSYDLFRPKTSLSAGGGGEEDSKSTSDHSQWRKAVAAILSNRSNGDSATLTAIGDGLKMSGWIEASHVCYLLSPSTSPMDGYDGPSVRMTLIGTHSPEASSSYVRDLDHIILTEVFEFALSLQPIAKGAEAYHGLAYLQPYRLLHAYLLAEMGEVKQAIRYCDSIMTLLKNGKMNRHYHPVLLSQLQELSNRLHGDTKSVNGAKKKPTMDSVWGALEGRFTKFIAGEDEIAKGAAGVNKGAASSTVGPFSHYSAITPDATSGGVSRVQSTADFSLSTLTTTNANRIQSRPGSAIGFTARSGLSALHSTQHHNNHGSEHSYGDYPTSSARDSSGLSSPKQSIGQRSFSSDADLYTGPYTSHAGIEAPWYDQNAVHPESAAHPEDALQRDGNTPTDSPFFGYQPHGATQAQFVSNVDEDLSGAMGAASLDEPSSVLGDAPTPGLFINNYAPTSNTTTTANKYGGSAAYDEEEEEEDLGFGNKTIKARVGRPEDEGKGERDDAKSASSPSPAQQQKESDSKAGELKPTSSWFGRLWKRDASSDAGTESKAKKAHMGEEVSFYYDKELKRWINKKAGESEAIASTPPPPPRAQTASPSVMNSSALSSNFAGPGFRRVVSEARPSISATSSPPSSYFMPISKGSPSISEGYESNSDNQSETASSRPPIGSRLRSNLADHSQPPALQPGVPSTAPSRPIPEGGPPRSMSGPGPPKSKKPISKRYVRVD
ncbi:hypothetical protein CBS101457_004053 [Exobasidium rhododendri]|nr:hypothetical protein CBS101457_004053 [Exobasidium rhododendri]